MALKGWSFRGKPHVHDSSEGCERYSSVFARKFDQKAHHLPRVLHNCGTSIMPTLTVPRITVMVVDDDAAQARWLAHIVGQLIPEDADLVTLTDSCAAHRHVCESWVDIIITDLDMPSVDGLELIRQAKRLNPWLQSLIVTAASTTSALIAAGDIGAADYLVKPVREDEVSELLRQAIARLRRWRASLADTLWRCRSIDHVGQTS